MPACGEARDVLLELLAHARCAMRHDQRVISPLVPQHFGLRRAEPGTASNPAARKLFVPQHLAPYLFVAWGLTLFPRRLPPTPSQRSPTRPPPLSGGEMPLGAG